MKKIITLFSIYLILFSLPSYAGFWSQFFANVASDSLKGEEKNDPLIKEKKIQGSLAVMGFYEGNGNGDLDTFESRTAIKKFQKDFGLEQTGILLDKTKATLLYLSNLYVDLKKKGLQTEKQYLIYDEIDNSIESIKQKGFADKYLSFLTTEQFNYRIITNLEDASVYVNGEKVANILLGYTPIKLEKGEYTIKIKKLSEDQEWLSEGQKVVSVTQNDNVEISYKISPTKKRLNRLEKQKNIEKQNGMHVAFNISWMRCPLGETWNGSGCSGKKVYLKYKDMVSEVRKFNQEGGFAGYHDWRLPTLEEMYSIINCADGFHSKKTRGCKRTSRPATNTKIFPSVGRGQGYSHQEFFTSTINKHNKHISVNSIYGDLGYYSDNWSEANAILVRDNN